MNAETADTQDDQLLSALASARRRLEDVPSELTLSVRALLGLRDLDVELAELTYDSLLDATSSTSMRGAGDVRRLSFALGSRGLLDVEVVEEFGRRRLLGQLMPPRAATVQLTSRTGLQEIGTDESGSFVLDDLPGGPLALRFDAGEGHVAQTEWLTL